MPRLSPALLVALVAGLFLAGFGLRSGLGIELNRDSIESAVATLGWKGPALYVGLVTFRQFLLLPSALVLPVGGVVFGALSPRTASRGATSSSRASTALASRGRRFT